MITGHIVRQRLNLCDSHVVADTIDYLEAKFIFKTDDWDGLDKWVHFAKDSAVYDIRLTDNCIRKEDHLNLSAGMWKVYLHGNEFRDGEVIQRITTDEAVLYVSPTGTLDGEPFPKIPASETERILARLEELEENVGGITSESDPTVPAWAKADEKPTYTKSEVGLGNVDNVRQYSADNPPPYPVIVIPYGDTTYSFEELYEKASQGVSVGVYSHYNYTAWMYAYAKNAIRFRAYQGTTRINISYLSDGTWQTERLTAGSLIKDFYYGQNVSFSDISTAADEYAVFLYITPQVDGISHATGVLAGINNSTKTATFIVDIANGKRIICKLVDTTWSYEVEDKHLTEESDPTVPDWAKQENPPKYTASDVGALPASTKIPGKTSDLVNDSGFITNVVDDLTNYYTKSQTYTQAEVNALVSAIPKFAISVVDVLPTSDISTTTVYLVKSGADSDLYTEYIYVNGAWEILGSQRVDLTGYATETWVETKLADYLTAEKLTAVIIEAALGYTPADAEVVTELSEAIADVISDKTVYSKNLLNTADPDYMVGYLASNETGNPREDSAWNLTGYIGLQSGDSIVVSHRNVLTGNRKNNTYLTRIYAYDADKNFLGATYNTGITYYTASADCMYVRCSYSASTAYDNYQIEYGTEETEYEAYFLPYTVRVPHTDYVQHINTSELNNDAGFMNKNDVEGISGIVNKAFALPETIYGFVNVPMCLYPYNYLQYCMDDVYIYHIASNHGKMMSDRWEYTPTAAEIFAFKIFVSDHSMRELNAEKANVIVKSTTEKTELTVMVIGDSTVQAGKETQKMLDLANTDGYPLTLIGTRGITPNLTEGRGGWTASMYAHDASNPSGSVVNAFYNPDTGGFDFAYYMETQSYDGVDCVFIQLGINDLFSYKTDEELAVGVETYLSDLDIIVGSIHSYDSDIKIVINTIFPSDTDQNAFADNYGVIQTVWRFRQNVYQGNRALIQHFSSAENVYVSWFGSSIDVKNNMGGDVHPTTDGYSQLGTQMYGVMRAIN